MKLHIEESQPWEQTPFGILVIAIIAIGYAYLGF